MFPCHGQGPGKARLSHDHCDGPLRAMSIEHTELARRLRLARQACHMPRQDVAKHVGLSPSTVYWIEVGRRAVRSHELHRFASLYVRDVGDFLGATFEIGTSRPLRPNGTSRSNKHVFLSFRRKHKALVHSLCRRFANTRSFSLCEYSTTTPCAGAWKRDVERIIQSCSATICMVGDTTYRSEPVNWEIQKTADHGKSVLAVFLTSPNVPIPSALSTIGVTPTRWNIRAIEEELHGQQR